MSVSARSVAAGLAGGALLLAAGCGSSAGTSASSGSPQPEPAESALVGSMQTSVRSATSVHVDGKLSSNGAPVAIDLDLQRNGDLAGTVSQNGAPFEVIGVSGTVYVKATPEFLRQIKAPAGACTQVCGKWIELQQGQARQITGDLSMGSMTSQLVTTKLPKFSEAGSATVEGKSAWVLRSSNGSVLDVSSTGSPYPLTAVTATSPQQTVTYSHWNSVPPPSAPPASEVLKLNGIG